MTQRIILVTGGNGGLGQAIARNFLSENETNRIWLTVHSRRELAEQLKCDFPERVRIVELDVAKAEAWKTAVQKIVETEQRLDVLVNNAGRHEDGLLATMPASAWDNVLSTNLDS
ncbi:MAG: SDR family NAD(P)-dependent oxidoreductase, partial [Limisphaerales bacterium]